MLDILTLGGASIWRNGAEVTAVSAHKQKLALIFYVAVQGPVARDRLLGILWPEKPEGKARRLLSQALYELRRELGDDWLSTAGDQVSLVPDNVNVDVKRLEVAAQNGHWEDVIELYQGHFLDHFYLPDVQAFEDWQTQNRAWVARRAREGFSQVIASRFHTRDNKGALDVAWRWTRLEPLEDEAHFALIALLGICGHRAAALEQYEAFSKRVASELSVVPLGELARMVDGIRSGKSPPSPLMGELPSGAEPGPAPAPRPAVDVTPRADSAVSAPADIDQLVKEELAPRLEIVRKLGKGQTANVYLAWEQKPRRRVAVKVFSPKLASDKRARLRFDREVQAVASLTHPNIASLLWAGSLSNGLPYFVMEYIDGPSMAEHLRLTGRFSNEEARRVLSQLASALAAAHRRGIVHRDVQPANILCDQDSGRCLLADFGVAGILSSEGKPVRITDTDQLVWDPAWMSPEQAQTREYTERSDVYNLGLIGYQLLAEEGPFLATSRQELFEAQVEQKPRKLVDLRHDVQPDMAALLERCLAKEPRRRPSAAAVTAELAKKPVEPEPKEWLPRLIWRRVPQWLGAYLAGGFGVIQLLEMLVPIPVGAGVFHIALISYLLGAPVVFILAWYHGRAGPQRPGRLEIALLSTVVLIWLAVLFVYLWLSADLAGTGIFPM